MPSTLDELEQQALSLPETDRRRLAERLWDSVVTQDEVAAEFTPEQLAEFERRSEDLRTGRVKGIPAEEVFAEIDRLLDEPRA